MYFFLLFYWSLDFFFGTPAEFQIFRHFLIFFCYWICDKNLHETYLNINPFHRRWLFLCQQFEFAQKHEEKNVGKWGGGGFSSGISFLHSVR